jgi:hypothetical protein
MELANKEWKGFRIEDLFSVKRGKRLIKDNRKSGRLAYYSASDSNNGLTDFISNPLFVDSKKIIYTTFGGAYYVSGKFTTSDEITILGNKNLNKYSGLFVSMVMKNNRVKFAFGYKAFTERVKRQTILLPVNSKGELDYAFMENYMRQKETELLKQYKKQVSEFKSVIPLSEKEWKEFKTTDIFNDIQRGKRLKKEDHKSGIMPYVSSTGINNGVDGFVGNEKNVRIFSDCLTLANSGSVGATFYQPFSFVASDHITKLENSNFNTYIYLFIANMMSRFSEKYSFNREINDTRIKKEKILLPTNSKNEPDYAYMENYMKALESKKIAQYLEYKEQNMHD